MDRVTQTNVSLDGVDRKILALLQENSKRTLAEIGAEVSLSAAAVKRRIDRLERDRVIRGYGAIVSRELLGSEIEALVEIYCSDRTSPRDVKGSLAHFEEIVAAWTVSGEPDALARIRVQDIPHLEGVVERLRRDPNIVRTRTLLVLSTIIDR
jgi:Lrp/AsnC family transcriptional regulator, leucine-responsive regulatory protein